MHTFIPNKAVSKKLRAALRPLSYAKLALLICTPILINACATIAAREHIVPIDSQPRGLAVYASDRSDAPLGITPFFANLPRAYRQDLAVGLPNHNKRANQTFTCGANWTTGIAGNFVLSSLVGMSSGVVPGLVTLAGVGGIDALTGNLFSCDDGVIFQARLSKKQRQKLKDCRTYFIAPPHAVDEKISEYLLSRWRQSWQLPEDSCDKIVDAKMTRERLAFLNMTHATKITFDAIARKNIDYLGYYTKANVFVTLQSTSDHDGQTLTPLAHDMLTMQEIANRNLPWAKASAVNVPSNEALSAATKSTFWSKSMSFFPNAVAYTPGFANVGSDKLVDHSDVAQLSGPVRVNTFPRALTSASAYSVLHPDGYSDWEFVVSFWPRIFASSLDQNYRLANKVGGDSFTYKLRGFLLTPLYEVAATLHTPIGGFSLGVGAGPTLAYVDDNFLRPRMQMGAAVNFNLSYAAFLTKNLFFTNGFDVALYSQGKFPAASAKYFRAATFAQSWLGFGYFIPEMRTHFRKWFALDQHD